MKIDGIGEPKRKTVSLSEFFGGKKIHVVIKPLAPYNKATIQEILTRGVKYHYDDSGKATSFEKTLTANDQHDMIITKLRGAIESHNMTSEGKPIEWNEKLLEVLNDNNPAILEKVIEKIDAFSFPEREAGNEDANPISTEKKSVK